MSIFADIDSISRAELELQHHESAENVKVAQAHRQQIDTVSQEVQKWRSKAYQ